MLQSMGLQRDGHNLETEQHFNVRYDNLKNQVRKNFNVKVWQQLKKKKQVWKQHWDVLFSKHGHKYSGAPLSRAMDYIPFPWV